MAKFRKDIEVENEEEATSYPNKKEMIYFFDSDLWYGITFLTVALTLGLAFYTFITIDNNCLMK